MAGFNDDEIKAELERRLRESKKREAQLLGDPIKGDTTCLHCGNPMHSRQASDPSNPLWDVCLLRRLNGPRKMLGCVRRLRSR